MKQQERRSGARTINEVFDPRANGLNLIRLLLAVGVIYRHSDVMLGHEPSWSWARALQRGAFVDAFFAVSGFLIVSSWVSHPQWRRFLRARVLRIFPAFLVCLVVTAFVFAPVYCLVIGRPLTGDLWRSAAGYLVRNAGLWINQTAIDGTPTLGELPGEWNGSLWTLSWEFICYLGVLGLGVAGLLRRRTVVAVLFVLASVGLVLTSADILPGYLAHHAARFSTMFLAGAVLFMYRDRIRVTRWLLAAAAVMVVACAAWLPDYRMLAALPLAYVVVVVGASIRRPELRLRRDVSYGMYIYAYPVQQMTIAVIGRGLTIPVLFVVSTAVTLLIALASWLLVERPALRRKDTPVFRRRAVPEARVPVAAAAEAGEPGGS